MAIREVRILGDPVLRITAAEVGAFDEEVRTLARDMLDTMYRFSGIGLAAPQVGVSSRVIVVDLGEADEEEAGPIALVNPRVVESGKKLERAPEGCLSIPGMEEVVERPSSVRVEGFSPEGKPVSIEATGLLSRALQHEIDHLDGILITDRLSPLKRRLAIKRWQKSRAEEVAS
jgi:peptide deformylase